MEILAKQSPLPIITFDNKRILPAMLPHSISFFIAINLGLCLAQTQVTVDTSTTYQTIDGFGFSEAFGFGEGVLNAPSAQQTQALNYMFSITEGAGFTILRNRIASDPSDTIEPTSPGSPAATPTYVWNGNDQSQVRSFHHLSCRSAYEITLVNLITNCIAKIFIGLLVSEGPSDGGEVYLR